MEYYFQIADDGRNICPKHVAVNLPTYKT